MPPKVFEGSRHSFLFVPGLHAQECSGVCPCSSGSSQCLHWALVSLWSAGPVTSRELHSLIPQSYITSGSPFSRAPRKPCAAMHCGARPLAPWLLALWGKSTSKEMNLQAALTSLAGSALGNQRSRRRHSDPPSEQQLKMCCSRPVGACTVASPTEQLAGCPTPAECQS